MGKMGWGYGRRSSLEDQLRRVLKKKFENKKMKVYEVIDWLYYGSILTIRIIYNKENKNKTLVLSDNIHKAKNFDISELKNLKEICNKKVTVYLDKYIYFNYDYKPNIKI